MSKIESLQSDKTFIDGLIAFENAIVDEYGFEYNSDSARISWRNLDIIREKIKENPRKYLYLEEKE